MKFTELVLYNFMRFKGTNNIKFSCDPKNNVTVVLGDNTVGKTTLAQAIRWVLYGEVISTQYDSNKDISILNNEILGGMTANNYSDVKVELNLVGNNADGQTVHYRIIRKATFRRKFPQLVAIQTGETLKMFVEDPNNGEMNPYDNTGKDKGKVDELISELLPRDLSSYFLFDGERWSDPKNSKADIKESVYSLIGISPIRQMKYHLGEYGPSGKNSVIKRFKGMMVGSGEEYESLQKDQERYYSFIARDEQNIKDYNSNAEHYEREADEIKQILSENPNVEEDQKEYEHIKKDIAANERLMSKDYADIVTLFSNSYEYFASPLLQQVVDMLKDVDLEGSDIPNINDKTIDAILQKGTCICGHKILPKSFEEQTLLKLREIVPPAVIGTIVNDFTNKLAKWSSESADLYERIEEKADDYQEESNNREDNIESLEAKAKKIDNKINFAEQRQKMNGYYKKAENEREQARRSALNITDYKMKISDIDEKLKTLQKKNEQNQRLLLYIDYAKMLYESASKIYDKRANSVKDDLNEIIAKNFGEMFNEQDKYPKLDEDFHIRLYYKKIKNKGDNKGYSDMEATGLSEGEKIARNFAFIVSILELSKKMRSEGEKDAQSLPLVLDGPFSKLSDANTAKVATVMPGVAEQVIIFMLDKDWEPSGLQEYTDPQFMYRIKKGASENSSVIVRNGEA